MPSAVTTRPPRLIGAPSRPRRSRPPRTWASVAEVACALTVSERTAGALLGEAHRLTTALPLTLAALQAGTISWQHARIMVDETLNLDPAGAQALEAHFLDPDAPNPARGPAGEMVPVPVPGQGPDLARTPPPGQHRKTPHQERRGPAAGVLPGPGRHGLALGLPPRRSGRRDLGPRHHRRPRPPGPHRVQDPHPAPRRHRRGLAPRRGRRPDPVTESPGPGHRAGIRADGPDRGTRHPRRVRAHPAIHGPRSLSPTAPSPSTAS